MIFFKTHKLRKVAKGVLHEARHVLNMNRDRLDGTVVDAFETRITALSRVRRRGAEEELEAGIGGLQALLADHTPPCFSPNLRELVETLVVAFGVAMAFRAYFFQPFKIPTGSMQPTLYGIHSTTVRSPDDGPGLLDRLPFKPVKWLVTGTWYREVVARADGSVTVYTDGQRAPGYVLLSVAGETFKVPQDAADRGDIQIPNARPPGMADNPDQNRRTLAMGTVRKGDRLWAGYITAGDQVFVNRLAWNFFPPKRDTVIVFATSQPELVFSRRTALERRAPHSVLEEVPVLPLILVDTPIRGLAAGQHYIKRLIGLPGETIAIRHPHVYADGVRIEGLPGIDRVAGMGESVPGGMAYSGYVCTGDAGMPPSRQAALETPDHAITLGDAYLPMGDNTRNSWDGRYWGGVPRRLMLGPGSCVYWPVSRRWGAIR